MQSHVLRTVTAIGAALAAWWDSDPKPGFARLARTLALLTTAAVPLVGLAETVAVLDDVNADLPDGYEVMLGRRPDLPSDLHLPVHGFGLESLPPPPPKNGRQPSVCWSGFHPRYWHGPQNQPIFREAGAGVRCGFGCPSAMAGLREKQYNCLRHRIPDRPLFCEPVF